MSDRSMLDNRSMSISNFAVLWKEYSDIVEAFELLYVERVYFEELLASETKLESIDDLEMIGQYIRNLHESAQVWTLSIASIFQITLPLDWKNGNCSTFRRIKQA